VSRPWGKPDAATAAIRVAVRRTLAELSTSPASGTGPPAGTAADAVAPPLVLVACSGGADSLALAAATAFEGPAAGIRAGAVVVDHGLQPASAEVAARAAATLITLGLGPVEMIRVEVTTDGAGV